MLFIRGSVGFLDLSKPILFVKTDRTDILLKDPEPQGLLVGLRFVQKTSAKGFPDMSGQEIKMLYPAVLERTKAHNVLGVFSHPNMTLSENHCAIIGLNLFDCVEFGQVRQEVQSRGLGNLSDRISVL